jgi:DNA (cytosine-5)-methyltransferase 1
VVLSGDEKPKFVDLFCGIGGASEGAAMAGYDVVLAVDNWEVGIEAHAQNHVGSVHLCQPLPPTDPLPLPASGEHWHLHGSPPCTRLSKANWRLSDEEYDNTRGEALDLLRWYVDFALASTATTWSMEQVGTPMVVKCLESYRAVGAPNRTRIDFDVFDFYRRGVPQHRRRLIAGSPEIVARLRRAPCVHRSVCDVIAEPRGTHVRNYVSKAPVRPYTVVDGKRVYRYIYYGPDACCNPVSGPSHTILAGIPLRWATPPTNGKYVRFTPTESAAVQCFPPRYILPKEPKLALRGVGNAIPPSIMKQLLTEGMGREPLERASASD